MNDDFKISNNYFSQQQLLLLLLATHKSNYIYELFPFFEAATTKTTTKSTYKHTSIYVCLKKEKKEK